MSVLNTAIIGGGIAGLACARQLHDAGHSFLLFTDRLGGRMHAGPAPVRNFGAAYITCDYRQVSRFVRRGPRVRRRNVYFPDGDRLVTLFHPRNVRHSRALARLYSLLIPFRFRFNALRAHSPWICQRDLMQADPLLSRYVEEPADEFVRRHGLRELHEVFTHPLIHSTLFVPTEQMSAFYFLACLMPILVPTYLADFTGTLERLCAGFEQLIRQAEVHSVQPTRGGLYRVQAGDDEWLARSVVLAIPCHNLRRVYPELDEANAHGIQEIPICTLHVAGRRRAAYRPGKIVFFRPGEPTTVLLPLADCDLLFTRTPDPDLSAYYEQHTVLDCVRWKTAIVLSGKTWRCLAPRPNLYTIGDYNICGLEDSFLTGMFAANQILRGTAQRRPYWSRPGFTGSPVR